MEKEFVPYELALRMKQLGFDEPCFAFYNGKHLDLGVWDWEYPAGQKRRDIGECPQAPTFSQAFRWFREKYSMYHQIHKGYGWEGIVRESNNNESILWHDGTYNSPEEAELACLEKLLSIVELKQQEQ
jgi:hypothetical protein